MSNPNPFGNRPSRNAIDSKSSTSPYFLAESDRMVREQITFNELDRVNQELRILQAAENQRQLEERNRVASELATAQQLVITEAALQVQKDANYFSKWRKPEEIKRNSRSTRIGHSISNSFSTFSLRSQVTDVDNVLSNTNNAAALTGIGLGVAGLAVFGVAAGIAASMGIAGLVLGLAALAYQIYTMITNRDAKHEVLAGYVWTLLDDKEPEKKIWKTPYGGLSRAVGVASLEEQHEVLMAANYLMKTADSQYKLMGDKLVKAKKGYDSFLTAYKALAANLSVTDLLVTESNSIKVNQAAPSADLKKAKDLIKKLEKDWKDAEEEDGAIHEYMRRLVHIGNYLQCAALIDYMTFFNLNKSSQQVHANNSLDAPVLTDLLVKWIDAQSIRSDLLATSIYKNDLDARMNQLK